MRVTADTNVLIRALIQDDRHQAAIATGILMQADLIAIPLSCLCECAWVLRSIYQFDRANVATAKKTLMNTVNVTMDLPAVEAGLALQNGGADFADGVIAYEGRYFGGEVFLSFDKKAVSLLQRQGHSAMLLAAGPAKITRELDSMVQAQSPVCCLRPFAYCV